jgi:hypothetical protein
MEKKRVLDIIFGAFKAMSSTKPAEWFDYRGNSIQIWKIDLQGFLNNEAENLKFLAWCLL